MDTRVRRDQVPTCGLERKKCTHRAENGVWLASGRIWSLGRSRRRKPESGGGGRHEIAGYANGENAVHVYVCIVNVREPSNVIELI